MATFLVYDSNGYDLILFYKMSGLESFDDDNEEMTKGKLTKPCLPSVIDDSPLLSLKTLKSKKGLFQSKLPTCTQIGSKRKNLQLLSSCSVSSNDGENGNKRMCLSESATSSKSDCSTDGTDSAPLDNVVPFIDETVLNICPVCYQEVTKKEKMSHFKKCASKHNISLAQMLDAVDLLKKHSEERKSLGLPNMHQNNSKGKRVANRVSKSRPGSDPELDLGLALSESMKEADEKYLMDQDDILLEAGLGHEVIARHTSLLEKYGFKSSRPVLPSLKSHRSRPGKLVTEVSSLLTRSHEERQRLISEKVSSILSAGENLACESDSTENQDSRHLELSSKLLFSLQGNNNNLWEKASSFPTNDDIGNFYYVSSLSAFISPSNLKLGLKLRHMSQVVCRKHSPNKLLERKSGNLGNLQNTGSPTDLVNTSNIECAEYCSIISCETYTHCSGNSMEIIHKLIEDWRSMIDNPRGSDVTLEGNGYKIYGHKLIFLVRCPSIIKEIVCDTKGENHIYLGYSCKSVKAFLSFIYCGDTSHLQQLLKDDQNEVLSLAKKFGLKDLEHFFEHSKLDNVERNTPTQYEDAINDIVSAITELEEVQESADNNNPANFGFEAPPVVAEENSLHFSSPCSPDPFADSPPSASCTDLNRSKCKKELFKTSSKEIQEANTGREVEVSSICCEANESTTAILESDTAKDTERDYVSADCVSPASSVICLSSNVLHESPACVLNLEVSEPNHLPINDSCSSLKKYLDDSFVDDLARSSLLRSPVTPISRQIPNISTGITSTPVATSNNGNVTPMPNYDDMDTPHLQKELGKYGIKRLKRRQAELMLRHIYEELHPMCEENNDISSINTCEESKSDFIDQRDNEEMNCDFQDVEMDIEPDFTGSQERDLSCLIDLELCGSGGEGSQQGESPLKESPMKTRETNLAEKVRDFLMRDTTLYEKILLFDPIWIEEIQIALKSAKYKPKLEHIMEFLDDEGITFRTMASKDRNSGKKS